MMKDKKYLIMLLVTIIGIILPLIPQLINSNEKMISVQLISQTNLQPTKQDELPDIKVTLDNKQLINPFLSILKITNSGSKPIISNDFETPIEIRYSNSQIPERVSIINKSSIDLNVNLELKNNSIFINPTLLNPQDFLTIQVINSGGSPSFDTHARIVGVSSIHTEYETKAPLNLIRLSIEIILAFLIAIPTSVSMLLFYKQLVSDDKPSEEISMAIIVMLIFSSFITCELTIIDIVDKVYISSLWVIALTLILTLICAYPFGIWINKKTT